MYKYFFRFLFLVVFMSLYGFLNPESDTLLQKQPPLFATPDETWVDSVFASMSLDEKIGQLFMVSAYTTAEQCNKKQIEELIQKYHIGGVIFMKGNPIRQVENTNFFQSISKTPLMFAIDGEWGLAMRLDSTIAFPKQIMLGAIQDNTLLYKMGIEIGRQCNRMGLHINFAPVVDINNNAQNPVINFRSFGEQKHNVAVKGHYYMAGMQEMNIITTAKHFPGHGDTDSDSHHDLPTIPHTKQRLDTVELYPFKYLINNNLTGMLIAHLSIPALDKTKNQASTLSYKIITQLLQNDLGFEGLIFTDALNMKGVTKYFPPGELEKKALLAGNDVLLFPKDAAVAISAIKKAVLDGTIPLDLIETRCKKILRAKKWIGLDSVQSIKTQNLYNDLNTPQAEQLNKQLIRAAITVVKDDKNLLPFHRLDTCKTAFVSFKSKTDTCYVAAKNYTSIDHFVLSDFTNQNKKQSLLDTLSQYNTILINVEGGSIYASRKYGMKHDVIEFTKQIALQNSNVILLIHASPYVLDFFTDVIPHIPTVVVGYDFNNETQFETAQVIYGAYGAKGKLPVSAGGFAAGTGVSYPAIQRLKYTVPFEAGLNDTILQNIDTIAEFGVSQQAFPGCQILVARKGQVVFQKSYGNFSYKNTSQKVTNDVLYDIASITKSLGTALSLMKLYDNQLFDLNQPLRDFIDIPGIDTTGKDTITIANILTHQSQLQSWIPFYQYMIQDYFNPKVTHLRSRKKSAQYPYRVGNSLYLHHSYQFIDSSISNVQSELYSVQVADNVYITKAYNDTIIAKIMASPLSDKKEVVYSDLGFYLFPRMIKKLSGKPIDEFLYSEFYNTLGAHNICYKPLHRFSKQQIAPTEKDEVFRKQIIQGHVHDPGAAMLGGISGHAGLFSNANDIAKISQMLLNGGSYGGIQYLLPETISLFTSCPFCAENNRKGYGFDKAWQDTTKLDPTCKCTSSASFGHSGFTGTIFWVDPVHEIIYVFLSNRVHPDAENNKIGTQKIRPAIQKIIYDAIIP